MKKLINSPSNMLGMAKPRLRGVFWIIDGELLAFPFSSHISAGIAKSGLTYNHKKLWPHIEPRGCNRPYNYYPRGRVDFTNKGKPVIYMNPNIDSSYLPEIKTEFCLKEEPKVQYDNSVHYLCYLDDVCEMQIRELLDQKPFQDAKIRIMLRS